jgi:CRISPR/Cas system-associated protein Csx1
MAVDKTDLRNTYLTFLEEDIIKELAALLDVDNRIAMELYYKSKLCQQIGSGKYDIEYMDSKYLANDLIENEPELLEGIKQIPPATQ